MSKSDSTLTDEQMNNSFLRPYKELGHHFDAAHGKCIHCKCPVINLAEDAIYGQIRPCKGAASGEQG